MAADWVAVSMLGKFITTRFRFKPHGGGGSMAKINSTIIIIKNLYTHIMTL